MKKIYLSILAIVSVATTSLAQTAPTCSLDASFISSNKVGIWPDSATNFISGTVGVPYVQNITVKVPKDTTSGIPFTTRACFNRFEVSSPSSITNYNLPPGLMLGSSTASVSASAPIFKFAGNANNCASIYGTPTAPGVYTLQLNIQPYVTLAASCNGTASFTGGSALTSPILAKYYIITIASPNGLQEIGKDKMGLYQNEPNPATTFTDIKFYVEGEDNASITIYNALGAKVQQYEVKTLIGENKVTINTASLSNGTYMYSLKYKNAIDTKRMIIINQ